VLLALLAEPAAGRGYHELVDDVVLGPAGMADTAFLRPGRAAGDVALGYLARPPDHPDRAAEHVPGVAGSCPAW
jgi:CubicO group peptidase (beta-lactamase class C family)